MGAYNKMRFLLLLCMAKFLFADVNGLINTILTTRDGATDAMVKSAPNPFSDDKIDGKLEPRFELSAIFDNQALINNHWVKLGMIIDGYKITQISSGFVVLTSGKKQKTLYLKKQAL
jgi:hypothetical protein